MKKGLSGGFSGLCGLIQAGQQTGELDPRFSVEQAMLMTFMGNSTVAIMMVLLVPECVC